MAFQFSLRPQTLTKLRRIRPLSSSTPTDSSADTTSSAVLDPSSAAAATAPPPPPSLASLSSDIKDRIFKKNHLDKPSFAAADGSKRTDLSFDFIRESLRKFTDVQPPKPSSRCLDDLTSRFTPPIKTDQLPSSIFGKEKIHRRCRSEGSKDPKAPKTEKELREKLRRLRSEVLDNRFSIAELNDRLVKLRELEEKVADLITELNDRLVKLGEMDEKVEDSIAELNDRLVNLGEMEEKVADSRMDGDPFRDLRKCLSRGPLMNPRPSSNPPPFSIKISHHDPGEALLEVAEGTRSSSNGSSRRIRGWTGIRSRWTGIHPMTSGNASP